MRRAAACAQKHSKAQNGTGGSMEVMTHRKIPPVKIASYTSVIKEEKAVVKFEGETGRIKTI